MPLNGSTAVRAAILVAMLNATCSAQGVDEPATRSAPATQEVQTQDDASLEILDSEPWREMRREFQAWLAVQQIYSAEEIASIVNDLNDRALQMSESEQRDLLKDMQSRLDVLMSPAAEEARQWVSQFRSRAQNSEERLRSKRPDVMNMTAQEIRDELQSFQQDQIVRQQAQATFDRTRSMQAEAALGVHAERRGAQQQIRDNRSRAAANAQVRSPYAPRPQDLPNYTDFDAAAGALGRSPIHTISPWGNPVRWHPLYGYWW